MTDVLILGGDGMLGHKLFQILRQRWPETHCTIRGSVNDERHRKIALFQAGNVLEHVDVMDLVGLEQLLRRRQPSVIVNAVGVIKQRTEAHAAIPSITVNALLPHKLVEWSSEWQGRVIHFSTDCVFSGKRGGYTEADLCDAEDLYGKSKYLGEVAADNALTLRTSIIGRELFHFKSLLEWLLAQNHKRIRGYKGALYSGVTTNYLAAVVRGLIADHPRLSGLYQVTGRTISKHELLCVLRDAYALDVQIEPDDDFACDRSMNGDKFLAATGYESPPWPVLAAQLTSDHSPYEAWR